MSDKTFQQNVVVLTGASRGIGREMALQLARAGAYMVLVSRDEGELELVAEECERVGEASKARAIVKPIDVTSPAQCESLMRAAVGEYGRIDTLINNAGQTMWGRFGEVQDLSIFERVMQVNYFGALYCTYYALPHLIESGGRLVAVSSVSGRTGVPLRSGYAASKHAMTGLFDSLRIELAGTAVSVTVAYPGFVSTGSHARAFGPDGQPLGENPIKPEGAITPEAAASRILQAALNRKREIIMAPNGRLLLWLKLVLPARVDALVRRAIERGRNS